MPGPAALRNSTARRLAALLVPLLLAPGCTSPLGSVSDHPGLEEQTFALGALDNNDWFHQSNVVLAYLGSDVDGAGDVDGDGYDELLVGAPGDEDGDHYSGGAFLFVGSAQGPAGAPTWSYETQGESVFGGAVAGIGDVNADGYDDLVVGDYMYSNGEDREGALYLFLGSATGPGAVPDQILESGVANERAGATADAAGDVNGDGYDDVIVGGYNGQLQAWLYAGSAAGLDPVPLWHYQTGIYQSRFTTSVAGVGDFDGDGYDDVALGHPEYTGGQDWEGQVSLFLGSATGPSAIADWEMEPNRPYAAAGRAVTGGDVNGDGYADLIFSAPVQYVGGPDSCGAVYVFEGGPQLPGQYPDQLISGGGDPQQFGFSLDAGDLDGDGLADLAVGAIRFTGEEDEDGAAYVYSRSAAGLEADPIWRAEGGEENAHLGFSVAVVRDLDGDGDGELLVSATGWSAGQAGEGAAFLFLGPVEDADGDGFGPNQDCDDQDAAIYPGADEYCDDVDNDCDGVVDEPGGLEPRTWYLDQDGDLYGTAVTTVACACPPGYAADTDDCDDADPWTYPGAEDLPGDGVDQNCDGVDNQDADGDGWTVDDGDCLDADPNAYPGAVEVWYDGVDQDCDGGDDYDQDGDSWPSDIATGWDCDDTAPAVLPWHCGHVDDLIVDGTATTLSGAQTYRAAWIVNGGRVRLIPHDGAADTGWLSIEAEAIYLDGTSAIAANGAGYRGGLPLMHGEGAGGGQGGGPQHHAGGGGGHGAMGGWGMSYECDHWDTTGGAPYGGALDGQLDLGSGGGGGDAYWPIKGAGGDGGGAIGLYAPLVVVEGRILADGRPRSGPIESRTGGGGAGGTVILDGDDVECSGILTARGGRGTGTWEGSGGSGAGGRIQVFYLTGDVGDCTTDVAAGDPVCNTGGDGTTYLGP